jgi:prevent-host-death family protein
MPTWKLEDAKNRFSEVVRLAMADQPQRVTRNGRDAVVVLSASEYDRLTQPEDLIDFMQASPLAKAIAAGEFELEIERTEDEPREIDFD